MDLTGSRYYVDMLPYGFGEARSGGGSNYWVVRDRESGARIPGRAQPTRYAAQMIADELNREESR